MPKRVPAESIEGAEREKRASTLQLLFKCARILDELATARVRRDPRMADLRPAHTRLFPHIDYEGTRLTELARRVGISKQATAQLVDELEAMRVLERVPDPEDGRAKLICFRVEKGVPVFVQGLAVLRELEGELGELLGETRMQRLHATLLRLESHLTAQVESG